MLVSKMYASALQKFALVEFHFCRLVVEFCKVFPQSLLFGDPSQLKFLFAQMDSPFEKEPLA
jgi:hypothetical protein